MIQSKHVSPEELRKLIHGPEGSVDARLIGEHVHQCHECRRALEALAAQSAIWDLAPALLKDANANGLPGISDSGKIVAAKARHDGSAAGFESTWNYPIENLLDRPQHPEMLGRVGKYDIEREIGRGGMGIVLKAHDAELNRPVAIKILAPHLANHGTARKRFAQEAIAAAGVLHPNVIAVYGVSNEGKTPFIVMPFIDGPSLQTLVDHGGPLTEIEIVRVALQISSGLAAAHSQGLVHRDIKPANILTEGGVHRIMITDFGLARAEDDASLTRTGWLMGTPNYMSPEQSRGQRADQRSDLFSLGSLIYFLATGRLPFRSETPLGVLHRIQNDEPTPVRQINHQLSQTLSDVIGTLLRKAPSARFQTANELHSLLERHLAYLHQPDISKPPKVRLTGNARRLNRNSIIAGTVLLTSVMMWSVGYLGMFPLLFQSADPKPGGVHSADPNPGGINPGGINSGGINSGGINSDSKSLGDAQLPKIASAEQDSSGQPNVGSQRSDSDAANPVLPLSKFDVDENSDRVGRELFSEAERLYEQDQLEESLAVFQESVNYASYAAHSNYNIACIFARTERPDEAFQALGRAVESGFDDEDHFRTDTDLTTLRGDRRFDELVLQVRKLGTADEVLKQAHREANLGRFAAAESLSRQALEINPANDDAATNLGYAIHMQGRLEEALPWHQRAARSADFKALGNYNLACYYSQKSETDRAFEYLNKAIQFDLSQNISVAEMKQDPDLTNVRDDARFAVALGELSIRERQRRQGLDPELVKDYQSVGLDPEQLGTLIRKNIPASLVLDYRIADLDLDEHKTLIQNRVPSALILKYRQAGLKSKEHELFLLQRMEPSEVLEELKSRGSQKDHSTERGNN